MKEDKEIWYTPDSLQLRILQMLLGEIIYPLDPLLHDSISVMNIRVYAMPFHVDHHLAEGRLILKTMTRVIYVC